MNKIKILRLNKTWLCQVCHRLCLRIFNIGLLLGQKERFVKFLIKTLNRILIWGHKFLIQIMRMINSIRILMVSIMSHLCIVYALDLMCWFLKEIKISMTSISNKKALKHPIICQIKIKISIFQKKTLLISLRMKMFI